MPIIKPISSRYCKSRTIVYVQNTYSRCWWWSYHVQTATVNFLSWKNTTDWPYENYFMLVLQLTSADWINLSYLSVIVIQSIIKLISRDCFLSRRLHFTISIGMLIMRLTRLYIKFHTPESTDILISNQHFTYNMWSVTNSHFWANTWKQKLFSMTQGWLMWRTTKCHRQRQGQGKKDSWPFSSVTNDLSV